MTPMPKLFVRILALAALGSFLASPSLAARIEADVYEAVGKSPDGRTHVLILLEPARSMPAMGLGAMQRAIVDAQTRVLAALPAADFEPRYLYENVPAMTGIVTAGGLNILAGHSDVIGVAADQRIQATLASSVANIRANAVQALGITGRGITVAVLDTGIDTDHPDLSDNIATGAYKFLNAGGTSGPGAEDNNGHGTATAGVITSRGVVAAVGVAPDADILAIKVLDADGGGWVSDWVAGIDYVVTNAGNYDHLAAISMSLGSFQLYSQCPCDNTSFENQIAALAVSSATSAGIVTIAASGNDHNTSAMSVPACLSDVIAVAATYDNNYGSVSWSNCTDATSAEDRITCFSNRSACNDLAAPGAFVTTPGIGGGTTGFGGTSAATPHVAGVVALMDQLSDSLALGLTVAQIEQTLRTTGHPTDDPANTIPNPQRIDAFLAVGSLDPGPPPTASAVTPASGYVDATADLIILGSNFTAWTDADFGNDILTSTATALSADSLFVTINVGPDAATGVRDIVVRDAFTSYTLPNAFDVLPTTRHYVSATGGNVYPYHTPANAAVSIADVLTAAIAGDSVLVDSLTISNASFTVAKSVTLYGGWTDNFTNRNAKTTLNLGSNILLNAVGGTAGLDGFIIQNGSGVPNMTPVNGGKYGGAMWIVNTTAVVNNCELRSNRATNVSGGFGGGGAIFSIGSTVTITNNHIHDNTATRGGGIHLYTSTGTVSGNTIENNAITTGLLKNPTGGGIAIEECSNVALADNVISNNTGAYEGGGVWVKDCTGITLDGGTISGHSASFGAGGIAVAGSDVTASGVVLSGNSGTIGGAVASQDTSDLVVESCTLESNGALIGAGIYGQTGMVGVRHNLFMSNTASNTGGAMMLSGVSGEVAGNTVDNNAGPIGTGGIEVGGAVNLFNNIVTNCTGTGIRCSGGLATLSHNLVWNSTSADYNGCAPGTGSVSTDPLFADPGASDYRLLLNSPAIDAGRPEAPYNDPDGSRGDMGQYGSHSFTMEQPSFPQNLAHTLDAGDAVLNWDRNPEGDIAAYAIYCDSTAGFVPSAANLLTTTTDTTYNVGAPADTLYYRVSAVDTNGYASGYSNEHPVNPNDATAVPGAAPLVDRLDQNVPNPFNPTTTIGYSIAAAQRVHLVVYDVGGRRVRTLVNGPQPASHYNVEWDGRNDQGQRVSTGVYFYRLEAGDFAQTRKMVLLK